MKVWKNGEIVLKQSDQILQTVIRWIIQIWRSNKSNKVAQRMFLYHVTTRSNMAVNLSKHKVRFYKQMHDRGPQVVLVLCRNLVLIPPFDTVVETPVLRACFKDSKYMYIDMGFFNILLTHRHTQVHVKTHIYTCIIYIYICVCVYICNIV